MLENIIYKLSRITIFMVMCYFVLYYNKDIIENLLLITLLFVFLDTFFPCVEIRN
jgi:hypothetical protein